MSKATLTFVNRQERTSKRSDKPYTSITIKAVEWGDKLLSGFGNAGNKDWRAGDIVDITVTETQSADGSKTYLNFDNPKPVSTTTSNLDFQKILTGITFLLNSQKVINKRLDEIADHVSGRYPINPHPEGPTYEQLPNTIELRDTKVDLGQPISAEEQEITWDGLEG